MNNTCIEISGDSDYGEIAKLELATCDSLIHPHQYQYFILRHFRDIQIRGRSECLELASRGNCFTHNHCTYEQGNQYFRYDIDTLQIHYGPKRNDLCLDVDIKERVIIANSCDKNNPLQKFVFGTIHLHMLRKWTDVGAPILDEKEIEDLKSS